MTIHIAQVKVYPVKGDLEVNHRILMGVLQEIAPHQPDVVITPEGFLDGYVATEEWVTRENIVEYAIDPHASPYVQSAASWAEENEAWVTLVTSKHHSPAGFLILLDLKDTLPSVPVVPDRVPPVGPS